jgi:DNA-binding MarR family transcriptional regulator
MAEKASPTPCYCTALRKAARNISQAYDASLRGSGLKATQFALLAELTRHTASPLTVNELAECLVMDRSTLGHNLRPLERQGFVAIKVDKDDLRSRRVVLTPKGATKFSEAAKLWKGAQERYERAIGQGQAASLRNTLQQIAALELS